ncbi:MAG: Fpg/Nei family DNA glycosylase [Thermovirgaceae bacterium]
MPELPDVEIMKRYLEATSLHRKIRNVNVVNSTVVKDTSLSALERSLKGKEFKKVRRHGKNLFVILGSGGKTLLFHFGMSGGLEFCKRPGCKPKHSRVSFGFKNGGILHFVCTRMLGKVSLIDSVEAYLEDRNIGPDVMSVPRERFVQILAVHRSSIKNLLMNQKYLAGLGNIYTDEVLFQSRLHPQRRVDTLRREERETLYAGVRRVLDTAIEANADPAHMPESFLLNHRKKGCGCPRCGRKLESISSSGRTTWFCSRCQAY